MDTLQPLLESLHLSISKATPVQGGDINRAYCLHTPDGKLFMKINDAVKYPGLFEKEAHGLRALAATETLSVPEVVGCGEHGNVQYLLLEWLEAGNANTGTWQDFGAGLAKMHQQRQDAFGFKEDNYLGTYMQENTWCERWSEFYARYRILPLIQMLHHSSKISTETMIAAENFCSRLDTIFPTEPAALLHGDLWGGNFIITGKDPTLIDPAVYCGHREMDIGMSRLFGGFNQTFYDAYNEAYPLEQGWEERLPYTQLYPLLFHAHAFGGHYVNNVTSVLNTFI